MCEYGSRTLFQRGGRKPCPVSVFPSCLQSIPYIGHSRQRTILQTLIDILFPILTNPCAQCFLMAYLHQICMCIMKAFSHPAFHHGFRNSNLLLVQGIQPALQIDALCIHKQTIHIKNKKLCFIADHMHGQYSPASPPPGVQLQNLLL